MNRGGAPNTRRRSRLIGVPAAFPIGINSGDTGRRRRERVAVGVRAGAAARRASRDALRRTAALAEFARRFPGSPEAAEVAVLARAAPARPGNPACDAARRSSLLDSVPGERALGRCTACEATQRCGASATAARSAHGGACRGIGSHPSPRDAGGHARTRRSSTRLRDELAKSERGADANQAPARPTIGSAPTSAPFDASAHAEQLQRARVALAEHASKRDVRGRLELRDRRASSRSAASRACSLSSSSRIGSATRKVGDAALPLAEQVAHPAQPQVRARDLEAVLACRRTRRAARRVSGLTSPSRMQYDCFRAAAHAAAQLVQLREAEALGMLDEHHRRVRRRRCRPRSPSSRRARRSRRRGSAHDARRAPRAGMRPCRSATRRCAERPRGEHLVHRRRRLEVASSPTPR